MATKRRIGHPERAMDDNEIVSRWAFSVPPVSAQRNTRPVQFSIGCKSCSHSVGWIGKGTSDLWCNNHNVAAVIRCERFTYEPGTDEQEAA